MSDKIGRRGLFGAVAGLAAGALGTSVVPARNVYEFARDELVGRKLTLWGNGGTIEIVESGDVLVTGTDGSSARISGGRVNCVTARDTRTFAVVGTLDPNDVIGFASLPYPRGA